MEIHLKIIGILLVILAFVHVVFPRYFNWKEELARLSLINKEIMVVHTFFISLLVFLMGLLCVFEAGSLINTPLGKKLCMGMAVFWSIRLFIQFFGYSSLNWKGKTLETGVHVFFAVFWTYLSLVFWLIPFSVSI